MKSLSKNICIMLIVLMLLSSICSPAKASSFATKILEGDITDKTTGLACRATSIYNYGPDDFAVLDDNDIVILDNLSSRLQRYCDGDFLETIPLPAGQEYLRLFASGRTLYVLSRSRLIIIDLDTRKQKDITFLPAHHTICLLRFCFIEADILFPKIYILLSLWQ